MKVWITKYALTDGIIEAQQIPGATYDDKEYVFFVGKIVSISQIFIFLMRNCFGIKILQS